MEALDALLHGFGVALKPINLLWGFVGVTLGTFVGVLPGVGPALTVAMLLPLTVKLDPTKKPKASETTYTEGPDKGKTFKGIYEIDGNTVKFSRAGAPDDERPTEFKTKPGSVQFVSVYKRAKQ